MESFGIKDFAHRLGISSDRALLLVARGILPGSSGPTQSSLEFTDKSVDKAQKALAQLKWLAIVTPENWKRLSADGISYMLFSKRQRPWVELMRPGQQLLFYISRFSVFTAWATINESRKARTVMWPSGIYSDMVALAPVVTLEPRDGIKIAPMVPVLDFIRAKRNWAMSVRRTLVPLTDDDFDRVTQKLLKAARPVKL